MISERILSSAVEELFDVFTISSAGHVTQRNKNRDTGSLMFYRLVLAGNVKLVENILLETRRRSPDLFRYLLSGQECPTKQSLVRTSATAARQTIGVLLRIFFFIVIAIPFTIITTPVFYIVHRISISVIHGVKLRRNIKLPVVYAAMSNKVDMVSIFLEFDTNVLQHLDDDGNNALHYLASISTKEPQRALDCFRVLMDAYGTRVVGELLRGQKNNLGITALELSVLIGSPLYFTELLDTVGVLKQSSVRLHQDDIVILGESNIETLTKFSSKSPENFINTPIDLEEVAADFTSSHIIKSRSQNKPTTDDFASACVIDYYNVTDYERGDIMGYNSFLLTLLSFRNLMKMDDLEVAAILNSKILNQWINVKSKSVSYTKILLIIFCYVIGVLFAQQNLTFGSLNSFFRMRFGFWQLMAVKDVNVEIKPIQNVPQGEIIYNAAMEEVFQDYKDICNLTVSYELVYLNFSEQYIDHDLMHSIRTVSPQTFVIIIASAFLILTDLIVRIVFMCRQIFHEDWNNTPFSFHITIKRCLGRPLQMSYVARQISVTSSCFTVAMILLAYEAQRVEVVSSRTSAQQEYLTTLTIMFSVLAMMLRLAAMIYMLRTTTNLCPCSRLVLTITKIFSFLCEVAIICASIILFFACILVQILYNPLCPLEPPFPGDSLQNAAMAVFKLMLADDTLPEKKSPELILTYACCVVLTSVTVLSLITGIAGAIAEKVLCEPLTTALQTIEEVKDLLEAETTSYVLCWPIRSLLRKWRLHSTQNLTVDFDEKGEVVRAIVVVEYQQQSSSEN